MVVPIFEVSGRMLALSSVPSKVAGVLLTERLSGKHIAEFEIPSRILYRDLKGVSPILIVIRNGEITGGLSDDFQFEKCD